MEEVTENENGENENEPRFEFSGVIAISGVIVALCLAAREYMSTNERRGELLLCVLAMGLLAIILTMIKWWIISLISRFFGKDERKPTSPITSRMVTYYPGKRGTKFNNAMRRRRFIHAKGFCEYCGIRTMFRKPKLTFRPGYLMHDFLRCVREIMRLAFFGWRIGNLDHVISEWWGGLGEWWNTKWACQKCNLAKLAFITPEAEELARSRGETIAKISGTRIHFNGRRWIMSDGTRISPRQLIRSMNGVARKQLTPS